ncbi:MAG: NAD/NADP octopine/nopaline dehydrogenase family protein [Bacteroidaceae bacterium]|nr:NAD/NADP octopine/nopaline dehydrogenase family protein [Bacteroidaceae bacterium]
MNVSVIGSGNVGMAIAADLSMKGHEVWLIKSSASPSRAYERLLSNEGMIYMKEDGAYSGTKLQHMSNDLSDTAKTDVVIVTIQSTYHEDLFKELCKHISSRQIVIVICSYMSSFYITKFSRDYPTIAEATGPYIEGRVELEDIAGQVVFRVGCRLTRSPLSVFQRERADSCMSKIKQLFSGWSNDYSIIESALLNPNLVIHTVGAIMSIPRIEYSHGQFCMYREAYARGNEATMNIMLELDKEKKSVLQAIGQRPIDVFEAGGFLGNPMESFYRYSESEQRAVSPTSVKSRYITEDVSQGLVLLESIAERIGLRVPVASSLIDISGVALGVDFRQAGRTIEKLEAQLFINSLTK